MHAWIGDGEGIHVVCLHLDLFERGRRQQIQRLVDRVQKHVPEGAPLIIAGDFNDWNQKISQLLLGQLGLRESGVEYTGKHANTFPSWRPFLALDRVYLRGFTIQQYQVLSGAPWSAMSDHAAVLVDIELAHTLSPMQLRE